jgi:hypothetical protein
MKSACSPRIALFQLSALRSLLTAGMVLLMSTSAVATNFTARISHLLLYDEGNLVYVYPEGGVQSPPACHGSNGNYMSFSMSRPRAKEYLAALLVAQATGKSVMFTTYSACIDQPLSDTLRYFAIVS